METRLRPCFHGLAVARWPQPRGGAAWFRDLSLSPFRFAVWGPEIWWNLLLSLALTNWFVMILCNWFSTDFIFSDSWSGQNRARKVYVLKSIFKVCVLWLPRYFRYSIEAKTSRIHKEGGDRSFTSWFTCVLKVLQCFKEWKERKIKNGKRSTVKHKEVRNIEEWFL